MWSCSNVCTFDLCNFSANATSLPKISGVVSLVPPGENSKTSSTTTAASEEISDDPAVCVPRASESTRAPQSTAQSELEEGEVPDGTLTMVRELSTHLKAFADLEGGEEERKEEEDGKESRKDPILASLLNEIVFLNQQLSGDGSKPSTSDVGLPPKVGEALVDRPAGVSLDDERSLSPLFLRLDDEDTPAATPTKSTPAQEPQEPQTDAIVPVGAATGSEANMKVMPASGPTPPLTPAPVLSTTTNGQSQPMASSAIKGDALVPPPLLQMKAGSVAPPVTPSLKENLSWRPMPRLVPL